MAQRLCERSNPKERFLNARRKGVSRAEWALVAFAVVILLASVLGLLVTVVFPSVFVANEAIALPFVGTSLLSLALAGIALSAVEVGIAYLALRSAMLRLTNRYGG